jgi:hypothetical protein
LPSRLTIKGGFTVDDGHGRDLQQRARRLGFADLRACLHALLDDGWSIPQLATHLGATQPTIRAAIADHHLRQPVGRGNRASCCDLVILVDEAAQHIATSDLLRVDVR